MRTTKQQLEMQVKHVRELLEELGTPIDLSIEYAYGQPRLVSNKQSNIISIRQSKSDLNWTIYAIKNVLLEIGYQKRQAERNS